MKWFTASDLQIVIAYALAALVAYCIEHNAPYFAVMWAVPTIYSIVRAAITYEKERDK